MTSQEPRPPESAAKEIRHTDPGAGDKTIITADTTAPGHNFQYRPEDWVGRRLGKYFVLEHLGTGGMGVVLKAHDASIERDVAIKVLPAEVSVNPTALNRFIAEAKSAGKLNHPHAVTIFEVAQQGSTHYLVLELVSGGSAEQRIQKSGPLSVSEATRMTIEACKGLAAAHAAGLVHRDVKPANLLLTEDGTVKVSDFGLAKQSESQTLQMTRAGQVVGTPFFMSPEQCESKAVDIRSDVYSLGATYYTLLTGKNPYEDSGSIVQVMFAHCHAAPPDPRRIRADVPAACARIIERAMATNPALRYHSMNEMRADLEAVLAGMSGATIALPSQSATVQQIQQTATHQRRFPWMVVGASVLVLAVIALGAMFMWGRFPPAGKGPEGAVAADAHSSPVIPAAIPPSGEPIRVGILHSLTGTMAHSESPVVDAALLAIDEVNRDGGLLGRPVEAIVVDGRSDPVVFAREAKRLIEQERVCTVFGCWTSASRKMVVPIFEEFDHLLIYPLQYEGIEVSPNVVYTGAAPNQQIIPAVKWAFAFGNHRRFFLVGSDYVFPRVAHEIIKDQLKELGAELVGEAFLPLGSGDVQTIIDDIVRSKPDVILNSINGDSNTAFFSSLRAAKITPQDIPTISFSIGEEELRQLDPSATVGDYAAWNYFQSLDTPENLEFVAAFHKKYGPQRLVTDPMEAAYVGVKLWTKAVQKAESAETAEIRQALRNQRMRAPEGDVRIDSATQHMFKTPRIGQVQSDGQFEIVWTAAKPEPSRPFPPFRTSEQWQALLHDLYRGWGDQWSAPAK